MSTKRMMNSSTRPPKKPDVAPISVPSVTLIPTATNPMESEMRAPYRILESTSLDRWSVPSRKLPLGPAKRPERAPCAVGSCGARNGVTSATT